MMIPEYEKMAIESYWKYRKGEITLKGLLNNCGAA